MSNMKFIDLKTGNLFDGSSPYIFWFDGQQSTNLVYSKSICFASLNREVNICIGGNPIFGLVDTSRFDDPLEINGVKYQNLQNIRVNNIISIGKPYHNFFVHTFYVLGSSDIEGEFHEYIKIGGETFEIGADFYGENESLYINLSNNGVEIPEQIQKSLYPVNVHEDKRDNITLNRKWKELLSNYLDIVGNKGSYKSLINSLKWFEYGDLVRLKEIWKMDENGIDRFIEKDLKSSIYKQYSDLFNDFCKTTYLALYCAMKEIEPGIYDEERNPIIKNIVFDWGLKDMMLKLSMLGNFYETYFMPIHLDLIHSTIEDIVYTNTFKLIGGTALERIDFINPSKPIKCNIENNSIYRLSLVECYVTDGTLFGSNFDKEQDVIVGVSYIPLKSANDKTVLRKYFWQLYKDIGSIINIHIDIPLTEDDLIIREKIWFRTYRDCNTGNNPSISKTWEMREDNKIFNKGIIDFNLLCRYEGEYEIRMQFESLNGNIYNKVIKFNVIDTEHTGIKIYKIKNRGCPVSISSQIILSKWDRNGSGNSSLYQPNLSINNNTPRMTNNYSFGIYKNPLNLSDSIKKFIQYIPGKKIDPYESNYDGVCLNHLLILEGDATEDYRIYRDYFMAKKIVKKDNKDKIYTICISRKFNRSFNTNNQKYYDYLIYRNDYIYMSDYHELIEFEHNNLYNDRDKRFYEVTDNDALCVIPDISFSRYISDYTWIFRNDSTGKLIELKSIKEPFITNDKSAFLDPGYYSIIFRYRLTNENKINEISLESAFIKR